MHDALRRARRAERSTSTASRQVLATFAQRALRRPRLAWALIAEPVDPLVDAERLAYRARYSELTAQALRGRDRRRRAARAERRADRGRARRRVRRGAGRTAVAARRRQAERRGDPERAADVRAPGRAGARERTRVRIERDGPVTTVLLSRPRAPQRGRRRHRRRARRRVSARSTPTTSAAVAVLHGEGGVFCAGADLQGASARPRATASIATATARWARRGCVCPSR